MHKYKMKVLIVSASFFPENSPRSFRTTELAKELSRQGHQVTIITPAQNGQQAMAEEYGFTMKNMGKLEFREIEWKGKNKFLNLFFRAIRRLFLILAEYPQIIRTFQVKNALQKESDYDLLISIAVPHTVHWGVAQVRNKQNQIAKVWVADCGDPYMGISYDRFGKAFYFKYLEKAFCKKADYITVPVETARTAYYEEFRNKIKVIPQGFKFEDTKALLKPYTKNSVPTFCYAGNFIPGRRDIRPILDYLLKTKKNFSFHIYTRSVDMVKPYLAEAKDKIILYSFISREELLPQLGSMDFLVNIENGISEQVPSKLIDYCLTERPTLSLDSNNLNTQSIDEFLEGNCAQQYPYPDIEQYRIENICQQFFQLAKTSNATQEYSKTE